MFFKKKDRYDELKSSKIQTQNSENSMNESKD